MRSICVYLDPLHYTRYNHLRMGKDLHRHDSRDKGIASRYRKWHSVSPVIMKYLESLPGISTQAPTRVEERRSIQWAEPGRVPERF